MYQSPLPVQHHSPRSDSDGNDQDHNHSIVVPAPKVDATDSIENNEQPWYTSSQVPTDLSIKVQGLIFSVHKRPLFSKCGYMCRTELKPTTSETGYNLKLEHFPGGSETFETILKFCYGFPVGLSPNNVAALRCAAEFLDMTEEMEDENLIYKTEAFLTFVVLYSWRDSITVLKSCESLYPWAQNVQLVRRCCDSIAQKASREKPNTGDIIHEESWWFDDVATLRIDHFMRIITAIRANGTKPESVGSSIMKYAETWLPDMDEKIGVRQYGSGKNELKWKISTSRDQDGGVRHDKEHRTIIESLVSILPIHNEGVSCKFLLWMLKMATIYSISPALIFELEKRVGMTLGNASVHDLLIPSHIHGDQGMSVNPDVTEEYTMHNTDMVQRILEHFLMHEQQQQQQQQQQKLVKPGISKLLDNYLAEIARDPNLSVTKFQVLAEILPENARTCDDGLYRAIDIYLKSHPKLSEHEQRRLCKVMNCQKLSLDACMHAAQNDRLPLRSVIQVLFAEQVKIRAVMNGKEQAANGESSDQEHNWLSTTTEITTLRVEVEKVKLQMAEVQGDYSRLQQNYDKLHNKQRHVPTWSFGWKKIRNSSLFLKRPELGESEDAQDRLTPANNRTRFRRRKSIS